MFVREPRVTIGIPVYNGEDFLEQAINSILAQTFEDLELIISDNASEDRTAEICREAAMRDRRIRYYRQVRNFGAARNYNCLVELARGEYFRWAAHDDWIAPEYVQRCVEALDRNPEVVLAYPQTIIVDSKGRKLEHLDDKFNLVSSRPCRRFRNFIPHSRYWMNSIFGLIRLQTLRDTGLIGAYSSSDCILMGELVLRGKILEITQPLFFRRRHPHMSYYTNPSFHDRYVWMNTDYEGRARYTRWRWLVEYLKAIHRVPMALSEKFFCYYQMLRWIKKMRKGLLEDLIEVRREWLKKLLRVNSKNQL